MTTFFACARRLARESSDGFSSAGAAGAAAVDTGAGLEAEVAMVVLPSRMSIRERFIALHMIWVSSRPDAPTMPPTATSRASLMLMPAMAPATPLREFSREMVMGMSAPPTRTVKRTPKPRLTSNMTTV